MSRRRGIVVLLLLLAGLALLLLPHVVRSLLERRLAGLFDRPTTVGAVNFRVLPFAIEVLDVSVGGMLPGSPPFLEVRRLELTPSLASLLGQRLVFSQVRVQGLLVRINAFPQGGDDIPRARGSGGGGGEVRIRRLVVEGGAFQLDHGRVPLDLDLPELATRLSSRPGGVLGGTLSFGRGRLRFGQNDPLTLGAELRLAVSWPFITVESARIRTERADLACTGRIKIQQDPDGEFHLTGPVDLDEMDTRIWRTGFGIKGDGYFDGVLGVDGPRLRFQGRMTGTKGVFDGVPVPRYAGEVGWDGKGVHLRGLELSTLGGTGRFEIEVPPGDAVSRVDAHLEGVDAEGASMWVFGIGAAGLGSAATGDISIRWPKGHIRRLSGRVGLDLAPKQDGRTPLEGRFEWSALDGVEQVEKADLRTPTTWARLAGTIQEDDRTDLALDGESSDLSATDDLLMRVRRALGSPEARLAGFSGAGAFRGRWKGTLQVPVFEGRFTGQDVGYLGIVWGRAEWVGRSSPSEVESHSLVLRRDRGEIWLDGRNQIGLYGEEDGLEVRTRFREWPAQDFIRAFGWQLDMTGLITGEANLSGRRSAPRGAAQVTAPAGRYYGVPYEELTVATRIEPDLTEVTAGSVRLGGGRVVFQGSVTDDDVYDGTAEAHDVELGEIVPKPLPSAGWSGKVSGEMAVRGTLIRPWLRGRLSSPRLSIGEEALGAWVADLEADGDGRLGISSLCRSARFDVSLEGHLGADLPYLADLKLAAQGTSLDPYLRLLYPRLAPGIGVQVTGQADLQGPLSRPRELTAQVSLGALELQLPDYPVRNVGPVRLSLAGGRFALEQVSLAGDGTDLKASGEGALLADGPLRLGLRGEADLRALTALNRRVRGRGTARLTVDVSGTRDVPHVEGTLAIADAGFRVRGFPHGFESVRGALRFTESAATLEGFTGTLGGGEVEMSGGVAYGQGRLRSFDIRASGHSLALRYPEGLRSLLDAELRYSGDGSRQWVTGNLDVQQALYTRRYDLASELLSGTTPVTEPGSLGEAVRYDIKLRAPGTLRIDNNLATLQARADLTLAGTADAPVVLGRAEIDRGRVYFQGNTYVIRRGGIDFSNPQRTDPFFDIEAETRLKSYRVTLKVNGTLERVYPTLSSDPPLAAVQILSLLAGADETTVATLSPSQTDQARLAATGAATLAAGRIAEEVGLERGAERLFGLNRFSIDPSVIKGGVTNPTARLTVGRRITPDLNVLYSIDLRGAEDRILSVEYTLSDRLSVLLTRLDPGGYGFDLRLRQSR